MKLYLLLFICLLMAVATQSTIIHVPGDQPTIQGAIETSQDYDTILVSGGTYVENLDYTGKSIKIFSAEDQIPVLMPADSSMPLINVGSGEDTNTELRGFTITGAFDTIPVIVDSGSYLKFGHCIVHHCMRDDYRGRLIYLRGRALIHHNHFYSNELRDVIYIQADSTEVINNTIEQGYYAIKIDAEDTQIKNNIIINGYTGIRKDGYQVVNIDYNNVWHNSHNYYEKARPGPHDISVNPLFYDTLVGRCILSYASPCRDGGDPNPIFNDPDGSRNDMGAIPLNDLSGLMPIPIDMNLGADAAMRVVNHNPMFYWTYYGESASDGGFEIQIGNDTNWADAEVWSHYASSSSVNSVEYGGSPPLIDGETYFVRLRLEGDPDFGEWRMYSTRMNRRPGSLVKIWPPDGYLFNYERVYVKTRAGGDWDGDSLRVFVEIYTDTLNPLPVSTAITAKASGDTYVYLDGLSPSQKYWWRAAIFDGYEYSIWTESLGRNEWKYFFTHNQSSVLHVPAEFETLTMAADASNDGDTILIASGIYEGGMKISDRSVTIMSESGADFTTIIDGSANLSQYCRVEGLTFDDYRLGIVDFVEVHDCVFRNCVYTPYYFWPWDIQGGGAISLRGQPRISNCLFENNEVVTGVIWEDHGTTPLYSYAGGGAIVGIGGASPTIDSCQFIGNTAHWGGAFCGYGSSAVFRHCLFLNNTAHRYGGAISGQIATLENCTFVGNSSPESSFMDVDGGETIISNCIITGHTDSWLLAGTTNWILRYCDVYNNQMGDWINELEGQLGIDGNISANPLFCDPTNGDFTVAGNSPCVGAGEGGTEIGAYGVGCQVTGWDDDATVPLLFLLSQNRPNPFNAGTAIKYTLAKSTNVKMIIYNILGQQVNSLVDEDQMAGEYEVYWDGTDHSGRTVASGIYIYQLKTDRFEKSRRLTLLK
jgi:predicted outer membrane repeat protein